MPAMTKEDYEYYKKLGVCVICHKEDAERGHVTCKLCRLSHNEVSAISNMRRYADAKKKGLCAHCHKRVAPDNFVTCDVCREKMRQYSYNRKRAKRNAA